MFMIFRKIFAIEKLKTGFMKNPIFLTDSDHDYILEEIEHRDKIGLEINSRDDGDEDFFVFPIFLFHQSSCYIWFFLHIYMHVT